MGGTLKIGCKTKHKNSASLPRRNYPFDDRGFNGSDPYLDSLDISSMSPSDVKEMFEKLLVRVYIVIN